MFKFFLKEATEDIASVFRTDKEGHSYTSDRVQLISIFTLIDVISNYWYEYLGQSGKHSERFLSWINKYCLVESNQHYRDTDLSNVTADNLYAIRCSMVHFFGIAGLDGDYKITFATNKIENDQIVAWRKGFRDRGHKVLIVKPKELHNLILEGTVNMLEEWKKIIADAQTSEEIKLQHIQGIDRIYKKIDKEGARRVPTS